MSTNISTELHTIATAKYGSDMREAIHDAINKINKSAFGDFEDTTISSTNYESLGVHDVTDLKPNKVYAIRNNITQEMVSNLPFYGADATIAVFQPLNINLEEGSSGYTVYLYSSGNNEVNYFGIAFSYSNNKITKWEGFFRKEDTTISSTNYESLGVHDVTDLKPNKVYAIRNNITQEMVSNLPFYGVEATIAVFQPVIRSIGDTTGYTVYLYSSGSSRINYLSIAFCYSNGLLSPWRGCTDGFRLVGKGLMYQTINDAILHSNDGDTIIIFPGTYEEHISVISGKELHFIGIDKHSVVVIDKSGDYRTPPFEIACGSISNMTIIETGEGSVSESNYNKMAYCIHSDYETSVGKTLRLENLILENSCHACIGVGVRDGYNLIIENCELNLLKELGGSGIPRGAFYVHTYAAEEPGEAHVSLRNTIIKSNHTICETLQDNPGTTVGFEIEHINCTLVADNSIADSIINNGQGGNFTYSERIQNAILSHGNNVNILNS